MNIYIIVFFNVQLITSIVLGFLVNFHGLKNPWKFTLSDIFSKLPTPPVFACKIFICSLEVGYCHALGIIIYFSSRP